MIYPNSQQLDYGYNTGLDTDISRVSYLKDDGGTSAGVHLEEYTYLGLDTIVAMNRPEDHTELTYIAVSGDTHGLNDGGDRYTGLDRFGRVDDQFWYDTSSGTNAYAVDRFQYGYDRDGNVLYKNNLGPSSGNSGAPSTLAGTFSELYHLNSATTGDNNTAYDALGRLTDMRRGTLSASANNGGVLDTVTTLNSTTGVTGNKKDWSLTAVGGWSSVTTDTTTNTQTTNAQNETTAAGGVSGLTYDNNGNLTKNVQGHTLKYDAWNRLVHTTEGSGYGFTYDAIGRINQYITSTNTNIWYHDSQNQLIETYVGGVYTQHIFGMAYVNEVILRDSKGTGSNAYGIAGSGLNTREYDQQDANWNTTSLYETGGASTGVIERLIYDAYGTPKTLTNAWASYSDTSIYWRLLYQGEYSLFEANAYIMGARMFDYTIGAWDQKDPIGYGDGMNDYQGFGGNPVLNSDPSGDAFISAGDNHFYPLYLGGSNNQPVGALSAPQHEAFHDSFEERSPSLGFEAANGDAARADWAEMGDAERIDQIVRAGAAAKLTPEQMEALLDSMPDIMAGQNPGVKTTRGIKGPSMWRTNCPSSPPTALVNPIQGPAVLPPLAEPNTPTIIPSTPFNQPTVTIPSSPAPYTQLPPPPIELGGPDAIDAWIDTIIAFTSNAWNSIAPATKAPALPGGNTKFEDTVVEFKFGVEGDE